MSAITATQFDIPPWQAGHTAPSMRPGGAPRRPLTGTTKRKRGWFSR